MTMRHRPLFALVALVAPLLLAGCEAIFTYSPLSFLQRPPSSLSPEARLTYAQDALASGDKAAMQSAYDAIKDDTSTDAVYTAAQLGIEISGVPELLLQVATDPSAVTADLNDIAGFIADNNLDPSYLVDAAARLQSVDASVDLTPTDYAMGALGILLGGTGGTWDITTASAQSVSDAESFFSNAVDESSSLPDSDPLKGFIDAFNSYLTGL